MKILTIKKLQDASTISGNGQEISVFEAEAVVLGVTGTSTSFLLRFQESLDGINFFDIEGFKRSDSLTSATTTSNLNESWEFDVSASSKFRTKLETISNGNVTVLAHSINY